MKMISALILALCVTHSYANQMTPRNKVSFDQIQYKTFDAENLYYFYVYMKNAKAMPNFPDFYYE